MANTLFTITSPTRLGVKYFPSPDSKLPPQIRLDVIDEQGDSIHLWLPIEAAAHTGVKLTEAAARHKQEAIQNGESTTIETKDPVHPTNGH